MSTHSHNPADQSTCGHTELTLAQHIARIEAHLTSQHKEIIALAEAISCMQRQLRTIHAITGGVAIQLGCDSTACTRHESPHVDRL
jgi:hypothetical protein